MNDRDPQSFDHFAASYDAAATVERRPDFFLDRLPARRRRALDLGCGTGILALELARHFESVVGLDVSEPMLSIAREKRSAANLTYRSADADHLVLAEKFDAIVSHTTFHHLKNIPRLLETLQAALEPGGRLLLVDLVNRWPWFPRHRAAVHVGTACARWAPDLFRHGWRSAGKLFRFRISRPWLDHLISDRYLTPAEFRASYGRLLPGSSFVELGRFMGIIWEESADGGSRGENPNAEARRSEVDNG